MAALEPISTGRKEGVRVTPKNMHKYSTLASNPFSYYNLTLISWRWRRGGYGWPKHVVVDSYPLSLPIGTKYSCFRLPHTHFVHYVRYIFYKVLCSYYVICDPVGFEIKCFGRGLYMEYTLNICIGNVVSFR